MKIDLTKTDEEIAACYPVMRELRPHLDAEEFLRRVRKQESDGYRLVCLSQDERPMAVAGIRIMENLAWGRFIYVDDLVTASDSRSEGLGARLLAWVAAYGQEQGCRELHLDSGVQRLGAHRFYEREGVDKIAFHFARSLK